MVRFSDPLHGLLGTSDGILGTTDGGTTWEKQLTGVVITKLWSYDETRAWALGADRALYRTTDGAHWTPIEPRPNPAIADLDVFSPDLLWAIGVSPTTAPAPAQQTGNVMRSDNGGATWNVVGTHPMWSVCFESRVNGVGADGKQIFRTTDAGRTWTRIATLSISDQGPWYPTLTCPAGATFRVQVTEPGAAMSHAPYLVFRTVDSGRSWLLEYREGYTLGGTTPRDTLALGGYPSLIGTIAGARNWIITCSPPAEAQRFLILDAIGTVQASETAPFTGCARNASFVDDRHGWVVATDYGPLSSGGPSRNVLMRTTDGGRTWSRLSP